MNASTVCPICGTTLHQRYISFRRSPELPDEPHFYSWPVDQERANASVRDDVEKDQFPFCPSCEWGDTAGVDLAE